MTVQVPRRRELTVRSMLLLLRIAGVAGLACAGYAWLHPARVSAWMARDKVAVLTAQPLLEPEPPVPLPAAPAAPVRDEPPDLPLPPAQAAVARWLGARYHVAPEAIAPLVGAAEDLEKSYHLSPHLLIAVMAIESNFHPYIESEAGAQGMMQVMPRIHARRYEKFGGKLSFINPMVSLEVGAGILHDFLRRSGSETAALRMYFGGGPTSDAYIGKVRGEQQRLARVAGGARVPID
jgi:soluble lytic murein transglycosylase-like protein